MSKYATKPFIIEAVQFTGENESEILAFIGGGDDDFYLISESDREERDIIAGVFDHLQQTDVGVKKNDYIIKGMKNEFYPCNPEVFEAKYELTE